MELDYQNRSAAVVSDVTLTEFAKVYQMRSEVKRERRSVEFGRNRGVPIPVLEARVLFWGAPHQTWVGPECSARWKALPVITRSVPLVRSTCTF